MNYALNDVGRANTSLHHVQWVRRHADGRMQGIDFADSFGSGGEIEWQGRPARFILKPRGKARLRKIALNEFVYETEDGGIPWFG